METNRPRSTLEVPRHHKGTHLEAPKPGPIHNHAPAFSEADFDRSKYAQNDYTPTDYARAEYVPTDSNTTDYNPTQYQPVASPAPTPPVTREQARRDDPTSWRNDPPSSPSPTGFTPTDPLRDDLSTLRYKRKGSALDPARPTSLGTSNNSGLGNNSGSGNIGSWQDAFSEITSDPQYGGALRIAALLFGLLLFASVGAAILGAHLFWLLMMGLSFALAKNADDVGALSGATGKLKSFLANFHPALATTTGLRLTSIALGGFSFFMLVASSGR